MIRNQYIKRFYEHVDVYADDDNGFGIVLDEKPLRTRAGNIMILKTEALAEAVADEWRDQENDIVPFTMHLTQIANTQIDKVVPERSRSEPLTAQALDNDLLCFLESSQEGLKKQEDKLYKPWRAWFEGRAGMRLNTTIGLDPIRQPDELHDYAGKYLSGMDDEHYTVHAIALNSLESFILASALVEGALTPEKAADVFFMEEDYRAALCGELADDPDPYIRKDKETMTAELKAGIEYLHAAES